MIKILFLDVKSDVRPAQNRLNKDWPQTHQVFAVDDCNFVEENFHHEPCPALEVPVR